VGHASLGYYYLSFGIHLSLGELSLLCYSCLFVCGGCAVGAAALECVMHVCFAILTKYDLLN
jgi:hypothetical protein